MNSPLTQEFVVSFLTTCFDEGLSKRAAAELLQKETVDRECAARPSFAEGYKSAADKFPGGLQPIFLDYGGMEKAARGNIVRMVQGLRDVFGGAAGAVGAGARSMGGGVRRAQQSKTLRRHPFASTLGAAGLASVGGFGANHFLRRDLNATGHDPFFSPGGFKPGQYQERFDDRLENNYAPGIYAHNKAHFGSDERRAELEKALEEGRGGADAYHELRELNNKNRQTSWDRGKHYRALDAHQSRSDKLMARAQKRQASLESQRTSLWGAPKRTWLSLTGRNPQEHFDEEIGNLHGVASQAKMDGELAAERKQLLFSGKTEPTPDAPPTREELEDRFFPSFVTN